MTKVEDLSVVICGIIRDSEKCLKKNIPSIMEICAYFGDYKIVIYENGSIDRTKEILNEWHLTVPDHVYILTGESSDFPIQAYGGIRPNPFFSSYRIMKMVSLRNNYLDYVEERGWEPDYLIVVDLDVARIDPDGVLSSFKCKENWDAVTAYGYSLSPKLRKRYHDTYALTEYGDEGNPQTEKKILELADKYGNLKSSDDWIRVYSAFGGLAIYRYDAIKGLRYQLIKNPDERVEVKCEHYSICKQMNGRGFDKIYINPAMTLKYQDVTWEIVLKWFKRKVSRC